MKNLATTAVITLGLLAAIPPALGQGSRRDLLEGGHGS
jgi:hypothetical protein